MLTDVLELPNWGYWVPGEVAWDQLPPAASIAMHWPHSAAFEGFLRDRGFRIVVTARHPLDVLISILQYAPTDPTTNRWLEGEGGDERSLAAGDDVGAAVRKHSPAQTAQRTPGHYWQGTPDLWKRLIVPELALAIRRRHPAAFSAFGFACDPDPALTPAQAAANWQALTANRTVRT
jgi:hypothetical protein